MKLLSAILLIVFMFTYAILGGIVFHYLESGKEADTISNADDTLKSLVSSKPLACNLSFSDIVSLNGILKQMDLGGLYINADGKLVSCSFWDFRSSILASVQLLTLIGSRNTVPHSAGGRAFAIVYILIGIFLLFGSFLMTGQLMIAGLDNVWRRVQTGMCKRYPKLDFALKRIVLGIVGLVVFILLPSVAFSLLEQWQYAMGVYYSITYLFSLGFGEYPAHNHDVGLSDDFLQWYRLFIGIWQILTILWFGSILFSFDSAVVDVLKEEAEMITKAIEDEIEVVEMKIKNAHKAHQKK